MNNSQFPYSSNILSKGFLDIFFIFLRFYLFIHERQRDRERERERGWDTGRGRNKFHAGSLMQDSILGLWDHALSWRQMLNHWATQLSHSLRILTMRMFLRRQAIYGFHQILRGDLDAPNVKNHRHSESRLKKEWVPWGYHWEGPERAGWGQKSLQLDPGGIFI